MIKRILTTIGAGRLIVVAMIAGIAVGALIAAPLFAAARGNDEEPEQRRNASSLGQLLGNASRLTGRTPFEDVEQSRAQIRFGGESGEVLLDGFFENSSDSGMSFRFEMSFGMGGGIHLAADLLETVAELTATDEEDVAAALKDGQTLAEYAEAHGVSTNDLMAALLSEAGERIDAAVEEGDLTDEEAERLRTELSERLSDLVNGDGLFGRFGVGRVEGRGDFPFFGEIGRPFDLDLDPIATVAELTGAEVEDVVDAISEGQTLAEFAAERGVSEDELIGAIMENAETSAAKAVAEGNLTQDEADELLAMLEEHARDMINGEAIRFHHRGMPGGRFEFRPFGGIFGLDGCDESSDGESTANEI